MHVAACAAIAITLAIGSARAGGSSFWVNGTFDIPAPYPGGFALVDVGERYGEWRVVGQAGNVSWTTGTYTHGGFQFVSQGANANWVNLAAISRTATGIVHAPVATTVGAPYTLTFYVGNIVDPTGFYGTSSTVNVYENSTLIATATNSGGAGTTTENWMPFTVTFMADAPYTSIAFINGDPPTDMNCGLANTLLVPGVPASKAPPAQTPVPGALEKAAQP